MPIEVEMADGSTFVLPRILTTGDRNTKLRKSRKRGYRTLALPMAAHTLSGYNVCPFASKGCASACIVTSGYAFFPMVMRARIARSRAWFQNRDEFKAALISELARAVKTAKRRKQNLAVRLNVFSDIPWERVFPSLFSRFAPVQFYDYTKDPARALRHARGDFPANYHLTFSRSETNERDCLLVLEAGGNVAIVFDRKELPDVWHGFPVINGDETDLRFLDPDGVVVGLYAKGRGRNDDSGFVVPTVEREGKRIALAIAP